jgi:xanthosine utilization system XapX-like protein
VLITWPSRRRSFSGSLAFLALAAGLLAGSIVGTTAVTVGTVVRVALCGLIALVVLAGYRYVSVRSDGRLVARTVFGSATANSKRCALGIAAHYGARSVSYTIYATDGVARVELADCWTRSGADRALARLNRCFCSDADSPSRARAEVLVRREQGGWESSAAIAKQQVEAYYASGRHRRVVYWVLIGLVVYVLLVLLFVWLRGERL